MDQNINYGYTVGYISTAASGFFILGYSFAYFNKVTSLMHHQYIAHEKFVIQDRDTFYFVISGLVTFGAVFGALLGASIAQKGRRFALMLIAAVFTVAALSTTVFNFFALFFGRLIMGLCIGAYVSVIPLTVCELSPGSISGPLGVIGQLMCVSGVLVAHLVSFLVPYTNDTTTDTTLIWKHIFALPALFSAIQFCLLKFFFIYETPTFYELNNEPEMYEKSMNRLFQNSKYVAAVTSLLDEQPAAVSLSRKKEVQSYSELFSEENRGPLIAGLLLGTFHQTTGISCVAHFSDEIFSKGYTGTGSELAIKVGTFGTGIACVVAALIAMAFAQHYGRRTIILCGEILMTLILVYLAICALNDQQGETTMSTLFFVIIFNGSFGSMLWLYVSEILGSRGIAVVAFTNLALMGLFGSFGYVIFDNLSPAGMFILLLIIQVCCLTFLTKHMKETMGRTKEEVINLYSKHEIKATKTDIELEEQ